MTGIQLIQEERGKQLTKCNKTIEHDIEVNGDKTLWLAALAILDQECDEDNNTIEPQIGNFPTDWTDEYSLKMASKPYFERLVIAGALIAAEIDRLQNNKNEQ